MIREDPKLPVDANSAEFKQGVEAGLNSPDDTKNWEAGNELGQELKAEGEKNAPIKLPFNESSTPLFMKDREDSMGNVQDEKDETEE